MAGSSSNQDIFDVRKIRRMVELMKEHDLSEIDLQQGEMRLQLRRDSHHVPAPPLSAPPVAAVPLTPAPAPTAPAAPAVAAMDNGAVIKSPIVGTFYTAPDPDSPSYIKVGDHVGQETTVCIVEAMKVFNEISAETSGKIIAVLVENGEPVEFGQPLFKVDTNQ